MIDSPLDPWEHGFGKLRDSYFESKNDSETGYNTNTYKKPEPLTYIRFELLLPTTEGWGYTII